MSMHGNEKTLASVPLIELMSLLAVGCGDPHLREPAATQACFCLGGVEFPQICHRDGRVWDACDCGISEGEGEGEAPDLRHRMVAPKTPSLGGGVTFFSYGDEAGAACKVALSPIGDPPSAVIPSLQDCE